MRIAMGGSSAPPRAPELAQLVVGEPDLSASACCRSCSAWCRAGAMRAIVDSYFAWNVAARPWSCRIFRTLCDRRSCMLDLLHGEVVVEESVR